jgi:GDPmannose 4,6-dehydratase
LGDLSAERDWSDARDIVQAMWLSLQAARPGDYVFASGQQRRVEDFVAAAFRAAGLDWREFVKTTARTSNHQQVTNGLCGDPRKAEAELGWKRTWSFEAMVADLVQADMENRPELERANPLA